MYDEDPHEPIAWPRRAAGRSDRNLRTALRNGALVRPLRGAYVDPERIRVPAAFYPYSDAGAALAAARAALAVVPAAALADGTALDLARRVPGRGRALVGPVELRVPVCGGRYRVDLVVAGRVLVEFEGTHHDAPDVQLADRVRFNALAALPGVRVLRYTSRDLMRLDAVVAEVRAALVRRP